MKRFILPLCLLLLLTINSCIDLSQTITINADGSGNETSTITFDKTFMDMITSFATSFDSTRKQEIIDSIYDNENFIDDMREDFDSVQGITLTNMSAQTNPDSSKSIYFSYDFISVDAIQNLFNSREASSTMNSNISYITQGDSIIFRITYSKKQTDDDDTSGTALREEIGKLFENDMAHTTVNFPYPVISTNGQLQGNSVTWNIPMETLYNMKQPVIMEAVLRK
jgi:hypothetical protein